MYIRKTGIIAEAAIPVLLMVIMTLVGCSTGSSGGNSLTTTDLANFQKSFMTTYYAEKEGTALGAKALTPFWKTGPGSAKVTLARSSASTTSMV